MYDQFIGFAFVMNLSSCVGISRRGLRRDTPRAHILVGVWLLLCIVSVAAIAIDERCSACQAVADSFYRRLVTERDSSPVDMRHRLDGQGKKYGKVIDYKVSELRVTELLDRLCEDMDHFAWASRPNQAGEENWKWRRVNGVQASEVIGLKHASTAESKTRSKELKNYCYGLIERTEDQLTDYLTSRTEHHEGLDEFLCGQIAKHCDGADTVPPTDSVPPDEL